MVELIPKKNRQQHPVLNILLYSSLALVVVAVAAFFILNDALGKSKDRSAEADRQIEKVETDERKVMRKYVLEQKDKIERFSSLMEKRLKSSGILDFAEDVCHPDVWFSGFSFDLKEKEARISASALNFTDMSQQMDILEANNSITDYSLENFSLNEEGAVDFEFTFNISAKALKQE